MHVYQQGALSNYCVLLYLLDVKAIQALTEDGNTPAVHTQ